MSGPEGCVMSSYISTVSRASDGESWRRNIQAWTFELFFSHGGAVVEMEE